jgi:hypothetical protein
MIRFLFPDKILNLFHTTNSSAIPKIDIVAICERILYQAILMVRDWELFYM